MGYDIPADHHGSLPKEVKQEPKREYNDSLSVQSLLNMLESRQHILIRTINKEYHLELIAPDTYKIKVKEIKR